MHEMTLHEYLSIFRRWKKVFITSAAVAFGLSLLVAICWSNYRSSAVVEIVQPEISHTMISTPTIDASNTEQMDGDQRINQIQEKVLSSDSLAEIISKYDLYPNYRSRKSGAAAAEIMAKKIKVDFINGPLPSGSDRGPPVVALKISFDYNDPKKTQQATQELVTRFIDEDLQEQNVATHDTVAFLDNQISTLEASMSEQEKKIADYQNANGISSPENLAFNQQGATTAAMSVQSLDAQITAAEGNIGSLQSQLAGIDPYSRVIADGQITTTPTIQLKSLQAQYAALTAQYGPEYPDVAKVRRQIEGLKSQVGNKSGASAQLKAQIADVKTNLAAAEKSYGPDHPDVVSLQKQLEKLEDQLATERSGPSQTESGIVADADNPVYLQISLQLRAAAGQLKSLKAQRAELHSQMETYQKAINQNPEAQKQMSSLTRDHENAQARYKELKEKRMAAEMGQQLELDRKGQRLTLISPAQLPRGTTPSRLMMIFGGVIVSFIFGVTCVFVAQMVYQVVIGASSLETLAGAAPLVSIPHIFTNAERRRRDTWKRFLKFTAASPEGTTHG